MIARLAVALIVTALGTGAACAQQRLEASAYNQRCAVDDDCVLVVEGDACEAPTACRCASGAIALDDVALYQDESDALAGACTSPATACAACAPTRAICLDGACGVANDVSAQR